MAGVFEIFFPMCLEGNYLHVSVTDTGIGMNEKTQEQIFDPFFTTKEKGKGTGLGLSVVYGVMKEHHGFVNVESDPEKDRRLTCISPSLKSMRPQPVVEIS